MFSSKLEFPTKQEYFERVPIIGVPVVATEFS